MLDTVRFEVFAPLRAGMADRLWQWRPQIRLKPGPLGKHLQYIECCSLPRLLWEHNGRLISNQAELDEALTKLWQEANTVAEMPLISTLKPMRLDLVWQFEGLLAGRVIDGGARPGFTRRERSHDRVRGGAGGQPKACCHERH